MTGRTSIAPRPHDELDHPVHLVPLVEELVARGNRLATPAKPYDGFIGSQSGWECQLVDPIRPEDWTALNERFDIPDRIVYVRGLIRDTLNWADIRGGRPEGGAREP